ncbi:hypothetical protein TNCV_2555561 [Trichonephila clavipes]|nr:hypothetical protein TNCV_2555561 [Trichonephila clavipes]
MTQDGPSNRKNNKQMFLNMVYALPSLQCLLRTFSAYSEPAGATFLAVGVPILQSASVGVVGCSPDDVIRLPQASHTYSMGFKSGEYAGQSIRVISLLSSSSSTARVRCGRALSSIKMKSGPMAPRNRHTWGRSTSSQ